MNEILKSGQTVKTEGTGQSCTVEQFLGGGGQGEVYRAKLGEGNTVALKWYFPEQATEEQRTSLQTLIKQGAPTDRFLWPIELTIADDVPHFGYIMPLREAQYKSIVDLMKRRIEPSFRALAQAGLGLADSFLQLHHKGLCYRDISFGNVFFDPQTGNVLICDNDNVAIDGETEGGVLGTPRFMAPEVVRGEDSPSANTDLFSLAVLLFYMFVVHHPLEGKRESEIRCFDRPAMDELYGHKPVFIFDPDNDTNRPIPGLHDNAIAFWDVYPNFLKELFTRSFTEGIRDPKHGRVRESEWRSVMVRLGDSIIYCQKCGNENFYDLDALKASGGAGLSCWGCGATLQLPPRIRIGKNIVMLNHDTRLFPHHIDGNRMYDFSAPVAEVTRHPKDPNIWGIKNVSGEKWNSTTPDGTIKDVEPGRSVTMAADVTINFGASEGVIRL